MISKTRYRSIRTKPISVRIDSDLLDYVRAKNLNLSSTLNHLLRGYLYIQNIDSSIDFGRLNSAVPVSEVHIDVYSDFNFEV